MQQADNALSPLGPVLTSATDDSVATPGSLSLSFQPSLRRVDRRPRHDGSAGHGLVHAVADDSAITASDGTVTITGPAAPSASSSPIQPHRRARIFSEPGDTGTLTADGHGGYLLTEADGTATDYNANGTLNYIQDTNGNRITAGYTSGQLTSLTASSGQSIIIAYNAAGLISTVTDSAGPRHDVHLRLVEHT